MPPCIDTTHEVCRPAVQGPACVGQLLVWLATAQPVGACMQVLPSKGPVVQWCSPVSGVPVFVCWSALTSSPALLQEDRPSGGSTYLCPSVGAFKLRHGQLRPFPQPTAAPTMLVRCHPCSPWPPRCGLTTHANGLHSSTELSYVAASCFLNLSLCSLLCCGHCTASPALWLPFVTMHKRGRAWLTASSTPCGQCCRCHNHSVQPSESPWLTCAGVRLG